MGLEGNSICFISPLLLLQALLLILRIRRILMALILRLLTTCLSNPISHFSSPLCIVLLISPQVLGPDVSDMDFVAYTCDQDAYAYSGQKCSAQSALFAHGNWVRAGILDRLKALVARRSLADNTIVPVLTVTNERFLAHVAVRCLMRFALQLIFFNKAAITAKPFLILHC